MAPDEEALLKHYRSLSVPVRAAIGLLVAKAAGVEEEHSESRTLRDTVKPPEPRERRKTKRSETPRLFR